METDAHTPKANGQTPPAGAKPERVEETRDGQAEQELLFKLKGAIDQNGRYSYRLNDLATGYAAGRGIPVMSARLAIEDKFAQQFGLGPKEYLERHYNERRGIAQTRGREDSEGPVQGRSSARGR